MTKKCSLLEVGNAQEMPIFCVAQTGKLFVVAIELVLKKDLEAAGSIDISDGNHHAWDILEFVRKGSQQADPTHKGVDATDLLYHAVGIVDHEFFIPSPHRDPIRGLGIRTQVLMINAHQHLQVSLKEVVRDHNCVEQL